MTVESLDQLLTRGDVQETVSFFVGKSEKERKVYSGCWRRSNSA